MALFRARPVAGPGAGRGPVGGQFAEGGAGRRLPGWGWVGSGAEAGYRAECGERGRSEQEVVEPAGGAGAGGVGDRGGRLAEQAAIRVPAPEATAAASRWAAPGGAGRPEGWLALPGPIR